MMNDPHQIIARIQSERSRRHPDPLRIESLYERFGESIGWDIEWDGDPDVTRFHREHAQHNRILARAHTLDRIGKLANIGGIITMVATIALAALWFMSAIIPSPHAFFGFVAITSPIASSLFFIACIITQRVGNSINAIIVDELGPTADDIKWQPNSPLIYALPRIEPPRSWADDGY